MGRLEIVVFEGILELCYLLFVLLEALAPRPASFLKIWLVERIAIVYSINDLIGELNEVKMIEGHLGIRLVICGTFRPGRREVYANIGNDLGTVTMGLQILGEAIEGLGFFARCGKDQAIITQPAGFVDTDDINNGYIYCSPGF